MAKHGPKGRQHPPPPKRRSSTEVEGELNAVYRAIGEHQLGKARIEFVLQGLTQRASVLDNELVEARQAEHQSAVAAAKAATPTNPTPEAKTS